VIKVSLRGSSGSDIFAEAALFPLLLQNTWKTNGLLASSRIPPDQDFAGSLLKEVRTSTISMASQSAVRGTQNSARHIIKNTELITALRRNVIDDLPLVPILPDRLRWIPDWSLLELYYEVVYPSWIPVVRRRASIGATPADQKGTEHKGNESHGQSTLLLDVHEFSMERR
jgi:hypothetical protein